jgi:hypothetical protein
MALIENRLFSLFTLILALALTLGSREWVRRGHKPIIRRLAALDALDDAVGRCAEMGRSLHYLLGWYSIKRGRDFAQQKVAGLTVLGYVSELAGKYGVPVHVSLANSEEIPLCRETIRQGMVTSGHPELYDPDQIQYITDALYGYFAGVSGRIAREQPAANIMLGPFEAEVCMFAETASSVGAVQIGGSSQSWQLPAWVSVVDYCLLGEELYAAGAYLSEDPEQQSIIMMLDYEKLFIIALVIIGALLLTAGNKSLSDFLNNYGK